MAFNGSGVHNRVHDWTQDLANTIPVTASRMDAEHDDMSAALSNCICRDGQSTTTARIPFVAGISAAAGTSSAVAYAQTNDLNTGLYFPGNDQWGLAAGGIGILSGTSSGVSVVGTHTVSGSATVGGTFAATGDITHHGQPIVPVGTVCDYAGASAPSGWLFCYGQAVSRSTYSALFSTLNTTYGSGDGATTFNLPDYRGRVIAGKDDMGGSSANRLTNQSGGLNGDTLGAVGGSETHALTEAQIAPHTHVATSIVADPGHFHDIAFRQQSVGGTGGLGVDWNATNNATEPGSATTGAVTNTTGITVSTTNTSAGGGGAHNNVQPTIIANKIIYTGVYS